MQQTLHKKIDAFNNMAFLDDFYNGILLWRTTCMCPVKNYAYKSRR